MKYRKCLARMPDVKGDRVHLFKSNAHYYEPAGPVSGTWRCATAKDWLVQLKAGDAGSHHDLRNEACLLVREHGHRDLLHG